MQAIAPSNSSDVAAAAGDNATLSAVLGREAAAGWAPFNHQRDGKARLGQLDLAFLGAYACGSAAALLWQQVQLELSRVDVCSPSDSLSTRILACLPGQTGALLRCPGGSALLGCKFHNRGCVAAPAHPAVLPS